MSVDRKNAITALARALDGAALAGIEAWEHGWAFSFGNGATVSTQSIWRVLADEAIVVTSEDQQQQFGLPQPVDAGERAKEKLVGLVTRVELTDTSSDLRVSFGPTVLEFLNTSSGYEGWHFVGPKDEQTRAEVVALGGGGLAIWSRA